MDFVGIEDYLQNLIGKEVTVIFSSGDKITGDLERVLHDALVLKSGSGVALCSIDHAIMVCEGSFESD